MHVSDSDANAFIRLLVATLDGSPCAGPGTWDQSKRDARFTRILEPVIGYTGWKPVAGNEEEWVVIGGSRVWTPSLTNASASRGAGSIVSEPVVDEPVVLD
ncbi:hypothetical protein PENSPDRAFT_651940 [Peniophora sp. CONT]|nr:hypothetical protein PENSPDRAFT_651940 [Peniophora sp. CONT]